MTLKEWLYNLFPNGCEWSNYDVSQFVSGMDSTIGREIKDSKIPLKWTNSELQWEPIINELYNHRNSNLNEQLAWVLLWLMVERTNGLWRLENAGGRDLSLQKISNWRSAMFCMRARLGVVDGWFTQQGGQAYSKWLYQSFMNPILFHVSPKNRSWDLADMSNRSTVYRRILEVCESPLELEHIELVDDLIEGSVFSTDGLLKLSNLESLLKSSGRKQQKRWKDISPVALGTLIEDLAHQAQQAQVINDFWHQNTVG